MTVFNIVITTNRTEHEKPLFITFEGPEGAGKTSVLQALIEELKPILGDDLVTTREPGGNPISEAIRDILQPTEDNGMDGRTEALLYTAARRQHLVEVILPALEKNKLLFQTAMLIVHWLIKVVAVG